jgi:H/ACA ribonucleoprotein complex subunit 2
MGSDTEAEKSIQKEKKKYAITLAPIAKPLAGKKLQKRTFKLIQKAAGKKCLKRGVKEVVKSIRRGQKGLVFSFFVFLLSVIYDCFVLQMA